MRRTSLIVVFVAAWMGMAATAMPAQMWMGHRHHFGYYGGYYDGYGYGYGVIYNIGSAGNAGRYVAQSERLMGQQIAAQQTAAVQSGIRESMSVDAQRRSAQIFNQQQANRDWWFQVEQQQIADRQQAAQVAAMTAASESQTPKVATDVIKWLPVLQAPQFAEQRAQIEAPYRRTSKGSKAPTVNAYQDMIKAAEQMKLILKGMTANITAQQYFDANAFLDKLAAEARERVEKAKPKK